MPTNPDQLSGASIPELARRLENGSTSARELVEHSLARIQHSDGEGARTFRTVNARGAREAAERMDALRNAGRAPSPFAGIPISIKDLFDVEGERTLAGSTALREAPAATADALIVTRLRAAGFILIGRTNMTEFAYSGLGLNPHYGTPKNPFDRLRSRIPGGSSSGAAVSVTDGMAAAGIGTDTGGSCRIPAAFCGIVGFKPTARRIPRRGLVPLSTSLDSIGSLANTVACCAVIDAVMAGETSTPTPSSKPPASLRLGVLRNHVLDNMDDRVGAAFERALTKLASAGIHLSDLTIGELDDLPAINAKGGLASAEAFAWHRDLLTTQGDRYDPRVRARIEKGGEQSAADYIDVLRHRRRLIEAVDAKTAGIDAVIHPTVPCIAPTFDALDEDADYARLNTLALRNPSITNFLDRCALSLPIHSPGEAPVGLNFMGGTLQDRSLLAAAASVESLFSTDNERRALGRTAFPPPRPI